LLKRAKAKQTANPALGAPLDQVNQKTDTQPKRFRWQAIPGTLTAFLGGLGLITRPLTAWMLWVLELHDFDGNLIPGAARWATLLLAANLVGCVLLLAASVAWWRCQNRKALLFTGLAFAIMGVAQHYARPHFPTAFGRNAESELRPQVEIRRP
jgi:hypothetical protein